MQLYADIYLLINYSTCFFKRDHVTFEEACSPDSDLYQRLQLQFYVLLMMGAMDARNT